MADISPPGYSSLTSATHADAIPWPSLAKLAPKKLRRSVSHLMADLERSVASQGRSSDVDGEAGEVESRLMHFESGMGAYHLDLAAIGMGQSRGKQGKAD